MSSEKINRLSFTVTRNGEYLMLVDLWQPKGAIDISVMMPENSSIVLVNGSQLAFEHDCTHIEVS